jgi:hypothetical protein
MKPTALPTFFEECYEYRQLHPVKEGKRLWRFTTLKGTRISLPGITEKNIYFHDKNGKVWGRIDRFGIHVEAGYSWNGCSPKRWYPVLGWVGTPDFQCTILASLVHDLLYQFCRTEHFPLHKSDVDAIFYHIICMMGDTEIASVYHGAVCKFGKWSDKPNNGEFSTIL